jgi:hypothetical protein
VESTNADLPKFRGSCHLLIHAHFRSLSPSLGEKKRRGRGVQVLLLDRTCSISSHVLLVIVHALWTIV